MKTKIKTIDIQAKEWYDKSAGNSYFSALITINYGMKSAKYFYLPFQYGYGEHYIDQAKNKLIAEKQISADNNEALWRYCDENNIILRTTKYENCLKRDVVRYGAA